MLKTQPITFQTTSDIESLDQKAALAISDNIIYPNLVSDAIFFL